MIKNRKLAFALSMGVSAVFLALALRGLHPEQFLASLAQVNPPLLVLAATVYFAALVVIALRWQFLLRGLKLVPLRALSQLVAIGYMGNNVYPLRAGDALRGFLLSRNHGLPLARVATIVVIERLFDGCVMLCFILFSLLFIDLKSPEIAAIVNLAAPLFVAAALAACFLAVRPRLLRAPLKTVLPALPQSPRRALRDIGEDVIAALEGLRSPLHLAGAVASSLLTWCVEAGTYWLVMFAFGLDLDYPVALLLVGAVNLAGIVPSSPGQVGITEFIILTILTALGIDAAKATAYAVVVHVVYWLPPTVAGFALLLRQGMGWADIREARDLAPKRRVRR